MHKILIADDEPNILDGLKCIIDWDEHGIEIAALAQNGADALRIARETNVNLLLTDIRMPRLDGLSLIRELKKENRDIRYIILSGYDDFEYIKEALKLGIENYLLKPVNKEELSTTLLGAVEKLEREQHSHAGALQGMDIFRENVLCRWLTQGMDEDELKERAALAGIDLGSAYYTAAIVRLLNKKGAEAGRPGDAESSAAREICKSVCEGYGRAAAYLGIAGETVLLFGADGSPGRERIRAAMGECVREINRRLGCEAFISVGSSEKGFAAAHLSFASASGLQSYSLIFPGNSIVDYDEITRVASHRQMEFVIDFQSFDRMLAAGDQEGSRRFVDDIFARLSLNRGITPGFVQNIAVEVLYHIVNAAETVPAASRQSAGFDMDFSRIYSMHTANELKDWLLCAVGRIAGLVKAGKESGSPHVKMVLSYILENYTKELSIKQLSCRFNINPAYLGQLFKNETGELFTNYINRLRIGRAKELLLTTNMSAAEISDAVGYPNANYFYRIFKKLAGISPSEFR